MIAQNIVWNNRKKCTLCGNWYERQGTWCYHKRTTIDRTEESAIDLVITSCDMAHSIVSIHMNESKNKVLTSITRTKKGIIVKESDHNSIVTNFNIEWKRKYIQDKIEIFNFNDKFKESTKKVQ